MVDDATAAGERYGHGWHPTTAAGVAPQVGETFDQSHRLHHLVGAVLFLVQELTSKPNLLRSSLRAKAG
jgi:hypothetical protein